MRKYVSACASLRPGQLDRLVNKIKDNSEYEDVPVRCTQCNWTGIIAQCKSECCPDCTAYVVKRNKGNI